MPSLPPHASAARTSPVPPASPTTSSAERDADALTPATPADPAGPAGPAGPVGPADVAPEAPPDGIEADGSSLAPEWLARWAGPGPAALLMTLGLLPMAAAAPRGGEGSTGADQVLWLTGLVVVVLPAAVGVFWPDLRSSTRLVLATWMALLLQVGRLVVEPDPLLTTSSYYPGLEVATDAVRALSGLPAAAAADVVLLAGRLVVALAVLLLMTRLTGSVRVGAGAVVVWCAHPSLLFSESGWSSVALALPLAVLALYLTFQRRDGYRFALAPAVVAVVAAGLCDPVTTALLALVLAAWSLVERVVVRRGRPEEPGVMALVALAALVVPLLVPDNPLTPAAVLGRSTDTAFGPWQTVTVVVAVGVTLAVLLPGLWRARRLVEVGIGLVVVLLGVALLYPLVPIVALTGVAATLGERAAGFVFLGVGFVVAWWVWQHRVQRWMAASLAVGATVALVGGAVLGAGSAGVPLPGGVEDRGSATGPRVVERADQVDQVDSSTLAAVRWMRVNLPARSAVFADQEGARLAVANGGRDVVRELGPTVDASRLLVGRRVTAADRALIDGQDVRYLVSDRRSSQGLRKFSVVAGVDVVYDNGSIVVYDLEALDGR